MCTVADKAKSAEDATRPERQSAQGAVPISKIAVEHASRLPNRWVHRKARVNPNIEDVRKSAMKVSTKIVGSEKATQRSTSPTMRFTSSADIDDALLLVPPNDTKTIVHKRFVQLCSLCDHQSSHLSLIYVSVAQPYLIPSGPYRPISQGATGRGFFLR